MPRRCGSSTRWTPALLLMAPKGAVCKIVWGVTSPLLANIALHGLEQVVAAAFPKTRRVAGKKERWTPAVIRYADDFVVLHPDLGVIRRSKEVIEGWLKGLGLELKPSKTAISHTLEAHEGTVGFD